MLLENEDIPGTKEEGLADSFDRRVRRAEVLSAVDEIPLFAKRVAGERKEIRLLARARANIVLCELYASKGVNLYNSPTFGYPDLPSCLLILGPLTPDTRSFPPAQLL